MLQQTRVETVIPYYERFLERFPTVLTLAEAPEDAVLGAWAGLGYYRRARSLHRAAKDVATLHAGDFPRTVEGLRSLPGVGEYTASAVASIAFGVRTPVLDGNVARVTARFGKVDAPIERAPTKRRLLAIASELSEPSRPGDANQALMELGATVCTPERPRCPTCPLRADCGCGTAEAAAEFPRTEPKRAVPKERWASLVVTTARGALLVVRRRSEGLFGGLWEPPMGEGSAPTLARALGARGLPAGPTDDAEVGSVKHVLTHKELTVSVSLRTIPRQVKVEPFGPYEEARWVQPDDLRDLGKSKLTERVLGLARRGS